MPSFKKEKEIFSMYIPKLDEDFSFYLNEIICRKTTQKILINSKMIRNTCNLIASKTVLQICNRKMS